MIRKKRSFNFESFRPSNFNLDPDDTLSDRLAFAMLGRHPGNVTAWDSSRYKRNGTLTNMDPVTDWVADGYLSRYAVDFDGLNDIITCDPWYAPFMTATGSFTIACWFFVRAHKNYNSIIGNNHNAGLTGIRIMLGSTGNVFFSYRFDGTSIQSNSNLVSAGQWYHVAMTGNGDGGVLRFWLDGKECPDSGLTGIGVTSTTPTTPVQIGATTEYAGRFLNGKIEDAGIWSRPLGGSEIQRLATRDPTIGGWIVPDVGRRVIPWVSSTPIVQKSRKWVFRPSIFLSKVFFPDTLAGYTFTGGPVTPPTYITLNTNFNIDWSKILSSSKSLGVDYIQKIKQEKIYVGDFVSVSTKEVTPNIDFSQKLFDSKIINEDFTQTIREVAGLFNTDHLNIVSQQHIINLENIQPLSLSSIPNIDWAISITDGQQISIDWLSKLIFSNNTNTDWYLNKQFTSNINNIEWVSKISQSSNLNLEFVANIITQSIFNLDYQGSESFELTSNSIFNIDYLNKLQTNKDININYSSNINYPNIVNIDYIKRLAASNKTYDLDYIFSLFQSSFSNIDYLQTIGALKKYNIDYQGSETSNISFDKLFNIDLIQGIQKTNRLNYSNLSRLTQEKRYIADWIGQYSQNNITVVDWMQKATSVKTFGLNWSKTIETVIILSTIDYLSKIIDNKNLNKDWINKVSSTNIVDIDWLLLTSVISSNLLNIDYIFSLYQNSLFDYDILQKLLIEKDFNINYDGIATGIVIPNIFVLDWIIRNGISNKKWILGIKGTTWILDSKGTNWTINNRGGSNWILNDGV